MHRLLPTAAALALILAWPATFAQQNASEPSQSERPPAKPILALTPDKIQWFTPSYYTDGRQRAQLFGNSSEEGSGSAAKSIWIDRVKIPAGGRALAHTHPQDELVTVIEGTWYLGEGTKFDAAKLHAYPPGSVLVIPAGTPHFVAAQSGPVIVQLIGTAKFQTTYLEK